MGRGWQHRHKSSWHWIRKWFLKYGSPNTSNKRKKKDKWDIIKIKNFYVSKGTKEEKHNPQWKRVFASRKEPLSRIHKELLPLNSKMSNSPIKNWAKDLNRRLLKDDTHKIKKHTKRCSTSFAIREIQT